MTVNEGLPVAAGKRTLVAVVAASGAGRSYRWLNPPVSSLVMGTVTGCLSK